MLCSYSLPLHGAGAVPAAWAGGSAAAPVDLLAVLQQHKTFPLTGTTKPIFNDAQVVASLTNTDGAVWEGEQWTYAFPRVAPVSYGGEGAGFSPLNAVQQGVAHQVMRLWDDLIRPDLTFAGASNQATITLNNSSTEGGYAHAYYPDNFTGSSAAWFNTAYDASTGVNDLMTPGFGSYGYGTFLHEVGHTLGLSHPGAYDGEGFDYARDAEYRQDSCMYTMMSYFEGNETGADWVANDGRTVYAQTPMMNDVLALQSLYGAEAATRVGNTTYGFGANAGNAVYDFAVNSTPVVCIFDGGGVDTLDLSGWAGAEFIDLAPGSFSDANAMTYNISIARGTIIENAVAGAGDDFVAGNGVANVLIGNGGADRVLGLAGNDTLQGGIGNDVLDGGADNDILTGGLGADRLVGGAGSDTASYADAAGGVVASLAGPQANAGIAQGDVFVLVENLTGSRFADVLVGDGAGNVLNGFGSADTMNGGGGNDIYFVAHAGDRVVEQAVPGIDEVRSSVSFNLAGQFAEKLTLIGTGSINGFGNQLANTLAGNGGANILNGLGGNDILNGGAGRDVLVGGGGNDAFVFSAAPGLANSDRIADFSVADDTIRLDDAVFAAAGAVGRLAASAFVIATSALDALDRILYDATSGTLSYDADGIGGVAAQVFAQLGTGLNLTAADFDVV